MGHSHVTHNVVSLDFTHRNISVKRASGRCDFNQIGSKILLFNATIYGEVEGTVYFYLNELLIYNRLSGAMVSLLALRAVD
jgi:hypothetical protein